MDRIIQIRILRYLVALFLFVLLSSKLSSCASSGNHDKSTPGWSSALEKSDIIIANRKYLEEYNLYRREYRQNILPIYKSTNDSIIYTKIKEFADKHSNNPIVRNSLCIAAYRTNVDIWIKDCYVGYYNALDSEILFIYPSTIADYADYELSNGLTNEGISRYIQYVDDWKDYACNDLYERKMIADYYKTSLTSIYAEIIKKKQCPNKR